VAILNFCSVYCGWREGLTIREIIAEQRRRLGSANPAERLAAALLIPGLLRERLRELGDLELGQVLDREVCSSLSVLAPELTVCMEAADRLCRHGADKPVQRRRSPERNHYDGDHQRSSSAIALTMTMIAPLPELTPKQAEAVETLFELHWEARLDSPEARTAFLAVALLLAQRGVLDYLVAALLKQAEALNIPPTKSLLFRDMAFEIEAGMRQKR